jgi:HSP20 family protein
MNMSKLAPWNWFKKEEEHEGSSVPSKRDDQAVPVRQTHPLSQIHNEIDRLFDDAFRDFGFPSLRTGRRRLFPSLTRTDWLKPTLDLAATDQEYTVSVELPGVETNEVKLELVNDTLRVSGEKRQEKEEKEKDFYRMERSYGSFQRVLSLPEDADQENIKAVFKNGVMTITLPRKSLPQSAVKQIDVKTS